MKTPITPSGWTLAILILPLIGAAFFARGDYLSVLLGLIVFQVYSVLDGCDGELARLKFLESPRGAMLDFWGDNVVHVAVFGCMAVGWCLATATDPVLAF